MILRIEGRVSGFGTVVSEYHVRDEIRIQIFHEVAVGFGVLLDCGFESCFGLGVL